MAFIIKPLVTEKMTKITDKQPNRYGFVVRPEANKLEIKKEIEGLYNVTVVDVNTIRYAGKLSTKAPSASESSSCSQMSCSPCCLKAGSRERL